MTCLLLLSNSRWNYFNFYLEPCVQSNIKKEFERSYFYFLHNSDNMLLILQAKKKELAYKSYFPAFLSKLEMMLSSESGPFILGDRVCGPYFN